MKKAQPKKGRSRRARRRGGKKTYWGVWSTVTPKHACPTMKSGGAWLRFQRHIWLTRTKKQAEEMAEACRETTARCHHSYDYRAKRYEKNRTAS